MPGRSGAWPARLLTAALAAGCAPGGIERIEHLDADGNLRRVELPAGASMARVQGELGRPNAIQRGPGATVYWLYTFEHMRHHCVLTFRGDRLAHVRYMPRPGEGP
jgi:hypothetical protein